MCLVHLDYLYIRQDGSLLCRMATADQVSRRTGDYMTLQPPLFSSGPAAGTSSVTWPLLSTWTSTCTSSTSAGASSALAVPGGLSSDDSDFFPVLMARAV